jgi:hypothetical protein
MFVALPVRRHGEGGAAPFIKLIKIAIKMHYTPNELDDKPPKYIDEECAG